jgi:dinuclear metal center YbgI/SA1388 family protein
VACLCTTTNTAGINESFLETGPFLLPYLFHKVKRNLTMATTVRDVIGLLETIAPPWMRYGDDPIGLHAGHPDSKVRKILLALDATLPVVREAKTRGCQMLITHHPRFYRPLANLDESKSMGAVAAEIARTKLAVYCAHTNLDVVPGGINDILADLAGMRKERKALVSVAEDRMFKLVTFIPEDHVETVRAALCKAGAGVIGHYTDCSFRTAGRGTFRGADTTKPYLGKAGRFEEVTEWRLEVRLPESAQSDVLRALIESHPYEEPAYDIYPTLGKRAYGQGRHGPLKRGTKLGSLARKMKKATRSPGVLVLGHRERPVRTVGVWSGAGFQTACVTGLGLDAVILGEIDYHSCEVLQQINTGCIALGHAPCEEVVLPWLAEKLSSAFSRISVAVTTKGIAKMWSV